MNDSRSPPRLVATERLPLGDHVLDLGAGELLRADGEIAALRKQALSVLLVLGARAGQVVGKDELMRQVWPQVVVGEGSLTQAVVDIRRVLGDHDHRLIRNVARRGYMLVPSAAAAAAPAPAAAAAAAAAAPAAAAPPPPADASAAPPASAPPGRGWRQHRWPVLALGATAVAAAVAVAAWALRGPAPARPDDLSIVVLPLVAEGGAADIAAFADVLHDDLIAEVSRFDASVVIARGTAATYRDRVVDPRAVARELKVRHVVSGSLRRDGDRMRLALKLVDGESGVQRWTEVFEVERSRLGAALGDSVSQLSRALYIHAWKSAAVRADALSPSQVTADDLATRAMGLWFRGLARDNVLSLLALAEQAVAADPGSARGWSMIAIGNVQALNNDWIVGAEARSAARQRADMASAQLDRIAPDGFAAMQARTIEAYNRGDFPAMLQRSRLWVERHPHPVAYGALGAALYHTDQPEAAMPWFERALRVSPLDPFRAEWMYRLALAHYIAGNLEPALHWARTAQATNPLLPWPPLQAAVLLEMGRRQDAQASWAEFHRRHPTYGVAALTRRLGGDFPRFAAARARLIGGLRELGMT